MQDGVVFAGGPFSRELYRSYGAHFILDLILFSIFRGIEGKVGGGYIIVA
jgi:hypothetical protein